MQPFCQLNLCNDGQPFSETACHTIVLIRITSSVFKMCMCTFQWPKTWLALLQPWSRVERGEGGVLELRCLTADYTNIDVYVYTGPLSLICTCAHKHTCRLADTRHWHSSCQPGPQLWLPQDIWGLPPQNRPLWSFQSPGACNQPYHTRGPFQSIATHSRENWTLRPNYGVFTIICVM